jgi:hypothetical protein
MNPRPLLHLEGTAVLAVSVFAYYSDHGGWGLFALLFLMPDVSMVGYLAHAQIGAAVYNAVHTPLLLALIWVAHIGLDRMLGFGLKYPTQFKDTHLAPTRLHPQVESEHRGATSSPTKLRSELSRN